MLQPHLTTGLQRVHLLRVHETSRSIHWSSTTLPSGLSTNFRRHSPATNSWLLSRFKQLGPSFPLSQLLTCKISRIDMVVIPKTFFLRFTDSAIATKTNARWRALRQSDLTVVGCFPSSWSCLPTAVLNGKASNARSPRSGAASTVQVSWRRSWSQLETQPRTSRRLVPLGTRMIVVFTIFSPAVFPFLRVDQFSNTPNLRITATTSLWVLKCR